MTRPARHMSIALTAAAAALPAALPGSTPRDTVLKVVRVAAPGDTRPLPLRATGRVERDGGDFRRQWPGTYFDTAFRGEPPLIRIGPGAARYRITLDDARSAVLVRPAPGLYRPVGAGRGPHRLRVQIVSESQAEPTVFGGFHAARGTIAAPVAVPVPQVEFIGDSHTVGYGNTAATTACTEAEVWATTDTAQGPAGQLARRYGAAYQVNAISGRGVVRNYDGGGGATLPVAYPQTLLTGGAPAVDPHWRPQVVVFALGTNDFSTPLHAGERWPDRAALHADYEDTYARFLGRLRIAHPKALLVVWATDLFGGEIAAEAERVVARVRASGERRIAFVPVRGLAFSACNGHPSVADDRRIAVALARVVDAWPDIWRTR